jgi:hypothetical protein
LEKFDSLGMTRLIIRHKEASKPSSNPAQALDDLLNIRVSGHYGGQHPGFSTQGAKLNEAIMALRDAINSPDSGPVGLRDMPPSEDRSRASLGKDKERVTRQQEEHPEPGQSIDVADHQMFCADIKDARWRDFVKSISEEALEYGAIGLNASTTSDKVNLLRKYVAELRLANEYIEDTGIKGFLTNKYGKPDNGFNPRESAMELGKILAGMKLKENSPLSHLYAELVTKYKAAFK